MNSDIVKVMKIGIVMDSIRSINFKKDSTLVIAHEAQSRNHDIYHIEPEDLFLGSKGPSALCSNLEVFLDENRWFSLGDKKSKGLEEFDIVLMRQDPPFNSNYIYNTYILDYAEKLGVRVINKPSSLRNCNEKIFATEFPQCCKPFLISSNVNLLKKFIDEHKDTVVKPLDGMGGQSIFRLNSNDLNIGVVLETVTNSFKTKVMVQEYIPEITEGDKRIILIDGVPVNGSIARIPQEGEFRGNLAAGGKAEAKELSERDLWICNEVSSKLKELRLTLVGLDVIGDYLTEINVTSPTCFQEYRDLCNIDVAKIFFDYIEESMT
tara:strand:- start:40651 stop:41616 length:966 start_codon:yes stop_codon:yes gene_type:complete